MFSDEEESDTSALLYLPIAPEIEDPEEGWGPPPEMVEIFKRLNYSKFLITEINTLKKK